MTGAIIRTGPPGARAEVTSTSAPLVSAARTSWAEVKGWAARSIEPGTASTRRTRVQAPAEDAVPALPLPVRRLFVGIAVVAVIATAVLCLATGSGVALLDLGLIALVALASLGLAGAVFFSPRQGRAALAAVALLLVVAGTVWVLFRAFLWRAA